MSDAFTSTSIETCSSESQTPTSLSNHTPRKKALRKKLFKEKKCRMKLQSVIDSNKQLVDNYSIETTLRVCEKYCSPTVYMLVKSQIDNMNRKRQGYRYSNDIKQLALNIYFVSPKLYRMMQKSLSLPVSRTLKRITSKYEINPGLNDFLFNFLSFKIHNFKSDWLDCVLCADEMALKTNLYYRVNRDKIIGFHESSNRRKYEPAKYALVLMLRSINYNWKQPIAYFLVSSSCNGIDLKDIILSTICRLQNIKLNIKAFITDQGTNFMQFSKSLYVSPSKPYFDVEGKSIVYIFDPPHLIKSTRNMFFKHNFQINDNVVTKDHLNSFYNYDSGCNLRLAPKLTYAHIYPGPFEKMRVYLATQVFSGSVAAGMSISLVSGILPPCAQFTIDFINDMDKLFDIFNSSKVPKRKEYNRPFKNTEAQVTHLNKMADVFKNLKVVHKFKGSDETKRMNFINGWLTSISGLKMLWNSLNAPKKKDYVLYTGRINQDCLENLFCTFRQSQGNNFNPTPIQFIWAFKKMLYLNYFQHSPGANCINDFDQIFSSVMPSTDKALILEEPNQELFIFKGIPVGTVDYRHLEIPERNSFTYVCGYLMKKCLEKHTCQVCVDYAQYQKQLDQSFLLSFIKAYPTSNHSTFGNLMMPDDDFYNYIYELENIFIDNFPCIAYEEGVGAKLKIDFCNVPYDHPCKNFEKSYLINLFTRFRIFTGIKFLNKALVSEKKLKNRKLIVLKHL